MTDDLMAAISIERVHALDPAVGTLLAALDAELDEGEYEPDQQFGYDAQRLVDAGVHLVGASRRGRLVGVAGVEVSGDHAELKRCYVDPAHRGSGVAEALLHALVAQATTAGARVLRLETGIRQHAALRFYRRQGFREIPRFGPYVDSVTSVCMERELPVA